MTIGALIFAFDNESIDYVAMAAWNSHNIRHHLGVPVAVVTDDVKGYAQEFDRVIHCDRRTDSGKRNFDDTGLVSWHNTNRMDAYLLSPWEQTLLLDADYVVASDQLTTLFDSPHEFMCYRWAHDITAQDDFLTMNYFGNFRMPMWWATVIMFRRSHQANLIFDCMHMVRENWQHYRWLYGNQQSLYRNDHALSIALNIESGHTLSTTDIPWSMATVLPTHRVTMIGNDRYQINYLDSQQKSKWIDVQGQDLHIMAKKNLGDIVAGTT
jgi:hypothetical protein